jgi:hypothetical protein
VLELLDRGNTVRATAKAVGCYPREVSRVGNRYLRGGLDLALTDDPARSRRRCLIQRRRPRSSRWSAALHPDGRARWTVRLVAEQAVERKIVDRVGRETIRVVLATHDLKPWREKNATPKPHMGSARLSFEQQR